MADSEQIALLNQIKTQLTPFVPDVKEISIEKWVVNLIADKRIPFINIGIISYSRGKATNRQMIHVKRYKYDLLISYGVSAVKREEAISSGWDLYNNMVSAFDSDWSFNNLCSESPDIPILDVTPVSRQEGDKWLAGGDLRLTLYIDKTNPKLYS